LELRDHVLLTVIWLRLYPIHEVLGYLFGVSDSTVSRLIERVLPLLEQSGRDGLRLPDPGKKRRRQLPDLLKDMPELSVIVDSFLTTCPVPPFLNAPVWIDHWTRSHFRLHLCAVSACTLAASVCLPCLPYGRIHGRMHG
jgi:hypothetical protein